MPITKQTRFQRRRHTHLCTMEKDRRLLSTPIQAGTGRARCETNPIPTPPACTTLHNRPTREPGRSGDETNPIPTSPACPTFAQPANPEPKPIPLRNKPDSIASSMHNLAQREKRSMTPFHNHQPEPGRSDYETNPIQTPPPCTTTHNGKMSHQSDRPRNPFFLNQ